MKNKKEFVTPTSFEIILTHKDKEVLTPIVKWLLKSGSHDFQWQTREIGSPEGKYQLSIVSYWASNLVKIAKLLGDYGT